MRASYPPRDIDCHTHAAGLTRVFRELRRKAEQLDLLGAGRGIDVAVGGECSRRADRPRLAATNRVEERERPGAGGGRQIFGPERLAEVVRRTAVFARPEEGERQIEAHPQQRRVTRQNGAEAGNGGFPIAPAKAIEP